MFNTWEREQQNWDPRSEDEPHILYVSFPSLKDPEHEPGPKQRHTGEVVTFVPWRTFEPWKDARWKKRGPDYEAFKKRLEQRLLDDFLARMPGLAPMLDHVELSTPATTHHFVRPMAGSIYGIEPTPERFACEWLRPRAPIKGLFFSGSEVATVGVVGAMMGGLLAGVAAEPMRGLAFLRGLR